MDKPDFKTGNEVVRIVLNSVSGYSTEKPLKYLRLVLLQHGKCVQFNLNAC